MTFGWSQFFFATSKLCLFLSNSCCRKICNVWKFSLFTTLFEEYYFCLRRIRFVVKSFNCVCFLSFSYIFPVWSLSWRTSQIRCSMFEMKYISFTKTSLKFLTNFSEKIIIMLRNRFLFLRACSQKSSKGC